MNSPFGFFIIFKMATASFLVFLAFVIYRMKRRGTPVKNSWCRKTFPLIGFFMFIAGMISFLVMIALSDTLKHVLVIADISLAAVFLGLLVIGLVAGKYKGDDTGSDWGPGL